MFRHVLICTDLEVALGAVSGGVGGGDGDVLIAADRDPRRRRLKAHPQRVRLAAQVRGQGHTAEVRGQRSPAASLSDGTGRGQRTQGRRQLKIDPMNTQSMITTVAGIAFVELVLHR